MHAITKYTNVEKYMPQDTNSLKTVTPSPRPIPRTPSASNMLFISSIFVFLPFSENIKLFSISPLNDN